MLIWARLSIWNTPDRVGLADHVVGGLVLGRDVLHREGVALAHADESQATCGSR
jgi:hypothetical protein